MKHSLKITLILLAMFFATQMIGLAVINAYAPKTIQIEKQTEQGTVVENVTVSQKIPYDMEPPPMKPEVSITSIVISIIIATLIFLFLTKLKANFIIKVWFFFVVLFTTAISLNALFSYVIVKLPWGLTLDKLALIIAFPMVYLKVIKRNMLVHNIDELLIYPGLAAVFVPLLNVFWTIVLLVLIAFYDMYAVWKSKVMIKMAKYQITKLKVFTGFFLPYIGAKDSKILQEVRAKYKNMKKIDFKKLKGREKSKLKKIRVSLAILGGGDIAFPLIFAGVVMRSASFANALIVSVAATLSLLFLFVAAKKEKFYPAMPFLSAGCIIGYLLSLLV